MPIPKSLYEQVRQRAQCRCEYCHYPELLSTAPLSIDHLQPQSLGGTDSPDNLALACRRCNERRYNFTTGILSTMKIMNAIELFPTLRNLTRADKLKVMQFLVSELAKDEEPSLEQGATYSIVSPLNSHAAAHQLAQLLQADKQKEHE